MARSVGPPPPLSPSSAHLSKSSSLAATEALVRIQSGQKEGLQASPLQIALERNKKAVIQGSMDLLLEIAASFPGGGSRGYENGPAFVPGEICRLFRSASEKILHLHKEPREVHMFVDLLLHERKAIQKLNYVEQVQVVSGELKEPPGIVLKGSNYHEPATDAGNESTGYRDDDVGKVHHMIAMIFDGMIPKTGRGKKAALPVSKDRFNKEGGTPC